MAMRTSPMGLSAAKPLTNAANEQIVAHGSGNMRPHQRAMVLLCPMRRRSTGRVPAVRCAAQERGRAN